MKRSVTPSLGIILIIPHLTTPPSSFKEFDDTFTVRLSTFLMKHSVTPSLGIVLITPPLTTPPSSLGVFMVLSQCFHSNF